MFGGYYQRRDLTDRVLIDVNGEKCYRTGDLARIDAKTGELVFDGRKDFQVKLRGQRIELGHIEHTIIGFSPSISSCIVLKHLHRGQEQLVAYVETTSNATNEEDARQKCLSSLPAYMIPSVFIFLEKFPVTLNGKVDRKVLPSLSSLPMVKLLNTDLESMSPMEVHLHQLWCEVLHMDQISMTSSLFSLHGTSLSFMKLYSLYQL